MGKIKRCLVCGGVMRWEQVKRAKRDQLGNIRVYYGKRYYCPKCEGK